MKVIQKTDYKRTLERYMKLQRIIVWCGKKQENKERNVENKE